MEAVRGFHAFDLDQVARGDGVGLVAGDPAAAEEANAALLAKGGEADTRITTLLETAAQAEATIATLQQQATAGEQERTALTQRLEETQSKLQGQDPGALVSELTALKKEQREWVAERRDVAARIEAICAKLDRLD